jgi:hypothetical protein
MKKLIIFLILALGFAAGFAEPPPDPIKTLGVSFVLPDCQEVMPMLVTDICPRVQFQQPAPLLIASGMYLQRSEELPDACAFIQFADLGNSAPLVNVITKEKQGRNRIHSMVLPDQFTITVQEGFLLTLA